MSRLTTIEVVADRLGKCAEELLALNKSTEEDFLTIGAHLRDLSTRAGEISSMATSAAGLINSEEMKADMGALQKLFTTMERHLESSDMNLVRDAGTLGVILKEVENAHKPLQGFKKIVKHLRMLAVSMKIESARLLTGDGSFSSIADDVEKLSTLIDSKSADILEAISSLRNAIGETLSGVGILEKQEHGHGRIMADSISRGLKSLSEIYALSSTTAYRIAGISEEIGGSIGGIVSALQYHDITRQQIEHVLEALTEMGREISDLKGREDGAQRAGELYVGDVCRLQVGQISNAKTELVTAVDHILKDLRNIALNGASVSKEIGLLIGMSGSNGGSFLVRLRNDVSTIIASLKGNGEASMELSTAIGGVARTIDDLSRFVGDIEDVGMEIELIALNARVKAAKTGDEGAALGVLAEGVRNLSDNSRDQTATVSHTLTHVTDMAKSLGGEHGDGALKPTPETGSAEGMAHELNGLLLSFDDLDKNLASLILGMEETSTALAHEIDELTSGITAHERTEKVLAKVMAEIEAIAGLAGEFPPAASGAKEREAYLKRFEERYTMHRERYVHNSRVPSGGSANRPDHDGAESFGENIEFF